MLLDIGMPKLNGYDLARRIRAEEWGRAIVLVALTGWGQLEDKQMAFDAGFDDHLTKPVQPEELLALLARNGATTPG
jgi:CheY-like chemotaxis protein